MTDNALFYKCNLDANDRLARTYNAFSVPRLVPRCCGAALADKDAVDKETWEVLGESALVEQRLRTMARSVAVRCHPAAKDGMARTAALNEHEELAQFFLSKVVRLGQNLAAVREEHAKEVTALKQ